MRPGLASGLTNYRPPARLAEIDTLIIDEISMVRADLFDDMSVALSRAKRTEAPFGGIQVVLVGDLFQLSPVVLESDFEDLAEYQSPYFFSSNTYRLIAWNSVVLETIFRQKGDNDFIELLNSIREAKNVEETLAKLNARVVDSEIPFSQPTVTLVPSNRAAGELNHRELERLSNPIFESEAHVTGEISLDEYKFDRFVEYAVGAQVVMAVNTDDYVNGNTGVITDIDKTDPYRVTVEIHENSVSRLVVVERYVWEVWRRRRKESVLVGSIEQLPFRLAWAVTVHRSQGQTYDRAIVDRDRGRGMFADGQLYVALSRCRSLDGLALRRPIQKRDVRVSKDVLRFYRELGARKIDPSEGDHVFVGYLETGSDEFGRLVEIAMIAYRQNEEQFRFSTLINPMRDFDLREAGISPDSVTLAPSVDAARTALQALLAGRVVITHRSNRLQDLLGLSDEDEGLWIDVCRGVETESFQKTWKNAVDVLTEVRRQFADEGAGGFHRALPVSASVNAIEPGLGFWDRLNFSSSPKSFASLSVGFDVRQLQAAVVVGAAGTGKKGLRSKLMGETLDHLSEPLNDAVSGLVVRALRDGGISASERGAIQALAEAIGLPAPDIPDRDSRVSINASVRLYAGMRVCLTGESLDKNYLREVLEKHGMKVEDKVTKSRCNLAVAESASSQSGNAKKARHFGIPVLSVAQFLSLVEKGVATSKPDDDDTGRRQILRSEDGEDGLDPATIRRWAVDNGLPVAKAGRVPAWIREKFLATRSADSSG